MRDRGCMHSHLHVSVPLIGSHCHWPGQLWHASRAPPFVVPTRGSSAPLLHHCCTISTVQSAASPLKMMLVSLMCRFMKVRLDRVLFVEVEGTMEEVTKCGAPVPDFERLDEQGTWRAPYSPYAPGWWNVFMPGAVKE